MKIRIGSRGSRLALFQAEKVRMKLKENHPLYEFDWRKITTRADKVRRGAISTMGTTGVFTKEIDEALRAKEIDLAVHSAKDIPTQIAPDLEIVAILERDEVRDALVTLGERRLSELPPGAWVGTSSPRRKAQLLRLRPDFQVIDMRGNVETRIRKLKESQCDALVMSACGLLRLGFHDLIAEILSEEIFLPAVSQGAIAVVIRKDDASLRDLCKTLNHEPSFQRIEAERSFLRELRGGCQVPVGAFTQVDGQGLSLKGALFSPDGEEEVRGKGEGPRREAARLGKSVAQEILSRGGDRILERAGPPSRRARSETWPLWP